MDGQHPFRVAYTSTNLTLHKYLILTRPSSYTTHSSCSSLRSAQQKAQVVSSIASHSIRRPSPEADYSLRLDDLSLHRRPVVCRHLRARRPQPKLERVNPALREVR